VGGGGQARGELDRFPVHVEGGTIGDHVEPFRRR
jgi:hypothetical protein